MDLCAGGQRRLHVEEIARLAPAKLRSLAIEPTPRIEWLVGELHMGYFNRWRHDDVAQQDLLFQTVRVLIERGCNLGLPKQVWLAPC